MLLLAQYKQADAVFTTKLNRTVLQTAVRIDAAEDRPASPPAAESLQRAPPTAMPGILRRAPRTAETSSSAQVPTTSAKTTPPLREKTSTVSFKGTAKPKGPKKTKSMNSLRSGPKIGSAVDQGLSVHTLQQKDLQHLARGLGLTGSHDSMPSPAAQESIRQTLADFADELNNGLANYDNRVDDRFLVNAQYSQRLTNAEAEELVALMKKTHMVVSSGPVVDEATGAWTDKVRIYFGGTQKNVRDGWHDLRSGLGMVGGHDRSAKRIAELLAKTLAPAGFAELEFLSGLSMGGGLAQVFLLALESRIELPSRPAVVLLDPLLLNNQEARHAIKGGTRPVDFSKPHAIAVTLDHPRSPRKCLMNRLKTFGRRRSPGLVRLKLALDDSAFPEGEAPKPMCFLGYHGEPAYYGSALARFAAVKPDDDILPAPRTDSEQTGSTAFGGSTALTVVEETVSSSPLPTSPSTDTLSPVPTMPVPDGLGTALMQDIFKSRQEVRSKLESLGGPRSEGVFDHHETCDPDFVARLGADLAAPKDREPLAVPKKTLAQRLLRRPARPAPSVPAPRPVLPVPAGLTVPAVAEPVPDADAKAEPDDVVLARWGLGPFSRG